MRCMWPVGADVGLCVTWESNCLSRKLHCPRNTVHVNLFFSFILRCLMALIRDVLMADSAGLRDDTVRYSTSVTDALPSYSPSLSSSSSPLVVSAIAAVQWHDMTWHDTHSRHWARHKSRQVHYTRSAVYVCVSWPLRDFFDGNNNVDANADRRHGATLNSLMLLVDRRDISSYQSGTA